MTAYTGQVIIFQFFKKRDESIIKLAKIARFFRYLPISEKNEPQTCCGKALFKPWQCDQCPNNEI
jgi:hypothetical protein